MQITGNEIRRGARGLLVIVLGVGTSENAAEWTVTGTVELIGFFDGNIIMNGKIRTRSRRWWRRVWRRPPGHISNRKISVWRRYCKSKVKKRGAVLGGYAEFNARNAKSVTSYFSGKNSASWVTTRLNKSTGNVKIQNSRSFKPKRWLGIIQIIYLRTPDSDSLAQCRWLMIFVLCPILTIFPAFYYWLLIILKISCKFQLNNHVNVSSHHLMTFDSDSYLL